MELGQEDYLPQDDLDNFRAEMNRTCLTSPEEVRKSGTRSPVISPNVLVQAANKRALDRLKKLYGHYDSAIRWKCHGSPSE